MVQFWCAQATDSGWSIPIVGWVECLFTSIFGWFMLLVIILVIWLRISGRIGGFGGSRQQQQKADYIIK